MDEITDYDQLAELESLLYSQVHHSADTEPPPQEVCSEPPKVVQNVYTPPRYFGKHPPAPPAPHVSVLAPQNATNNPPCAENNAPNDGQVVHTHQPVQFKMPQFCQPPMNNIVIIPSNLVPMSRQQRQKFNKQMKKSHEMTIQQAAHNAEVFRYLNNEDRVKALKIQKRQRYIARRKEKNKLLKEQQMIETFNNCIRTNLYQPIVSAPCAASTSGKFDTQTPKLMEDVIELSETDDDEVVALDKSIETVVLSSDEDCQTNLAMAKVDSTPSVVNEGDDGSVQYVELPPPETIVLDAEPDLPTGEGRTDAEMMKPPSDTTSTTSSVSSTAPANKVVTPTKSSEQTASRHAELMNTPESSNDFLDHTLDVSQSNFNFSLHGNDLAGEKSFLKPRSLAPTFESESSCSTSDISSLKNPVFNELEFESPAIQLFGEADLGSFSDFITPKRKGGIASLLTPCAMGNDQEPGPSTDVPSRTSTDSESSSESELEDDSGKAKEQPKRKRLPSLSHFDVEDLAKSSTPVRKAKSKKVVKAANKFDFIKDAVEEEARADQGAVESPKATEKKGKKRKQKEKVPEKGSDEGKEMEVESEENAVGTGSAKKRKKQKSKSDTEGENSENVLVEDKGQEVGINEQSNEDGNVSNVSEIEKRTSKKKKKRKSKGDALLQDKPENDNNKSSTNTPKRKGNTKSDSEVDDNGGNKKNKNCNEDENLVDTEHVSLAKRRKRKSRSECTVDEIHTESEMINKDAGSPTGVGTMTIHSKRVKLENVEEADAQSEANQSDVQVIDVPIECIDLSSGDDCDDPPPDGDFKLRFRDSTDDEESHFDGEELENFHTDIDLSNVRYFYVGNDVSNDATSNKENVVAAESSSNPTNDKGSKTWCTPGFDIDKALAQMSSDPKKWRIMERDRVHIPLSAGGIRCKKCREFGHKSFKCTRQLRCWLCGETEHQEPRCPNAICTNCGRSTRFFTFNCGRCMNRVNQKCDFCSSKGHLRELCPDFWRRYHLTVDPTAPVVSKYGAGDKMLKNVNERWCSGCAKPFHLESTCNYYNRTHNHTASFVHKYKDVYNLPPAPSQKTQPVVRAAPVRGPVWESPVALARNLNTEPDPEKRRVTKSMAEYDNERQSDRPIEISDHERHFQILEECARQREKKKGGADVDVDVQHKRIEVFHTMSQEALELLDTPRGREFLKSLFGEFSITYAFDELRMKLCGFPTDLLTVSSSLKVFFADPKSTAITTHLSHRNKAVIRTNCALLEEWAKKFNVKQALDLKSGTVCLEGDDVFNLLLCRHQIMMFVQNFRNCVEITQILNMPAHSVEAAQEHPYPNELARRHHVQWKINGNTLTFTGTHRNIQIVKQALEKMDKNHVATLPVLKQIKKILKLAEYPYDLTAEFVNNMINVGDYCALNSILLRGHHSFKKVLKFLPIFAARCFVKVNVAMGCQKLINYFHEKRPITFYLARLDEIRKLHKCDTVNIGSTSFTINLPEQQFQHILNAEEGKYFLSLLGRRYMMHVRPEESQLQLHGHPKQYEKAEEQIKFYFLILDLPFPNDPVWIYKELTRGLAATKLNYYSNSCQALFSLMCKNEGDCQIKKDLHGLLFTKYDFLDGSQHKYTMMQLLSTLKNRRKPLSTSLYVRIKMAAMYLFCPVAMNIDYKTLVSLAPPPPIIPIPPNQLKNTHSQIKDAVQFGLENETDGLMVAEYQTISEYLERNKYSNESLDVAKMFLGEDALK